MGSKISLIPCETLGRLDSGAVAACNGFASLRRISIRCDGIHAVSGTNDKEFEYLLIPSHPHLFGFLLPASQAAAETLRVRQVGREDRRSERQCRTTDQGPLELA